MIMKAGYLSLLLILAGPGLRAQLTLSRLFGNGMVLQRDQPVAVWGRAARGESVIVSFHGQLQKAVADASGRWKVRLSPMSFGGPFLLEVRAGNDTVRFTDVQIGDVWVCSGQSNMEFPVSGWSHVNNAEEEIRHADYPMIRLFTVGAAISGQAEDAVRGGQWEICSPATISPFSAVGYFFGRELYSKLKIPIGLINSTWGGTEIESWISRSSLDSSAEYREVVAKLPVVNLDSLKEQYKGKSLELVDRVQGGLPDPAAVGHWKDAAFDVTHWPVMQLPGLWDDQQLGRNFDGVVWFRKEVEVTAVSEQDTVLLSLGMIDDNDETFVNGVRVGGTNGYNVHRVYKVLPGIIHPGKNTIAVRVYDGGGGGGIYGEAGDLYLSAGGRHVALGGGWSFQVAEVIAGDGGFGPNSYPSLLYNAMINPLVPYRIKGVIWYQGEANTSRGYQYRKAMPLLIEDWRHQWGEEAMPFYFVQLTSFGALGGNSNKGSTWAELRESQALARALPHTGMAVTLDVGNPQDIHPRNKQDVGLRLAGLALRDTYGKPGVVSGPVFRSMSVSGSQVLLRYSGVGSGLVVKGERLSGFELAGADQHFYPAEAVVSGDGVMLSAVEVKVPEAVRYGWKDDASEANLYNKEGYPAEPFRTDHWTEATREVKYHVDLGF